MKNGTNGLSELKKRVLAQNLALKSNGLVVLTRGNVSGIKSPNP